MGRETDRSLTKHLIKENNYPHPTLQKVQANQYSCNANQVPASVIQGLDSP